MPGLRKVVASFFFYFRVFNTQEDYKLLYTISGLSLRAAGISPIINSGPYIILGLFYGNESQRFQYCHLYETSFSDRLLYLGYSSISIENKVK